MTEGGGKVSAVDSIILIYALNLVKLREKMPI